MANIISCQICFAQWRQSKISFNQKQQNQQPYQKMSNNSLQSTSKIKQSNQKDFQVKWKQQGGFGMVYKVKHISSDKVYAMKKIKKEKIQKLKLMENAILQKNILQINHPFVVKLKFSFQNIKNLYIVMEYIQGGELFFYLKKQKKFKQNVARFVLAEIVLAIQFLHQHKIIYRDLKPENILLNNDGHMKLTDFGLSSKIKYDQLNKTFAGTIQYIAPQILHKTGYSQQVDIWALGILLYEMISGNPPFYDPNRNFQTISKLIEKNKLIFRGNFSPQAKSLIQKMLIKNQKERITIKQIKQHPFFQDIKWEKVFNKEYQSPILPLMNKYKKKEQIQIIKHIQADSGNYKGNNYSQFTYMQPQLYELKKQ